MFDLKTLINRFETFTKPYQNCSVKKPENIKLKYVHTFNVLENCIQLIKHSTLSEETSQCALAACLFHDSGRFPQYKKYETFNDSESVNHAKLGVGIISRNNFLAGLPSQAKRKIIGAVALHNYKDLPSNTPEPLLTITRIVRDCDKLDIMHILLSSISTPDKNGDVPFLGLKEKPYFITESILKCVQNKELALYTEMQCINDFRLMLLSWTYDLNFKWTRKEVLNRGYLNSIFDNLPDIPPIKNLRSPIEKALNS